MILHILIGDVMKVMKIAAGNQPIITVLPGPGHSLPIAKPGTKFMDSPAGKRHYLFWGVALRLLMTVVLTRFLKFWTATTPTKAAVVSPKLGE